MIKFFIYFLLIMAVGTGAYYFTPFKSFADSMTDQYKASMIFAIKGKTSEVRNFIEEKVLPSSPEKKEEQKKNTLIQKLKDDLVRIESAITAADADQDYINSITSSSVKLTAIPTNNISSVKKLVSDSKNIITQLENASSSVNQGVIQMATQRIVEKILDSILPAKETTVDCEK